MITDRFGTVDIFIKGKKVIKEAEKEITKKYGIDLVDLKNLEDVYHEIDGKKKKK